MAGAEIGPGGHRCRAAAGVPERRELRDVVAGRAVLVRQGWPGRPSCTVYCTRAQISAAVCDTAGF